MGIFEFLYYLGYAAKKYYSLRNRKRLPYRVISIGNITVGGTGKTPATIAVAEEAKRRGFSPVILTRGYKGKAKGPCFVSPTTSALPHFCTSVLDAGDEPVLMAERLKDVPIVKCADRYKAGMFAIQNLFADSPIRLFTHSPIIFILDDGFQHWRLFRDKDILLIDAENPFDNKRLLPIGLLREPLKEIRRADIIVITKTDSSLQAADSRMVVDAKQYNTTSPIFYAEHKPLKFIKPSGQTMPVEWVKGKTVFAFCGIGEPGSFKKTLLSTGCDLKGLKTYRDHYEYKQNDIEDILRETQKDNADWIATTEKDLIRLKNLNLPENLIMLEIEFKVDEEFYNEIFK